LSARAKIDCGTVRPSALAVFKLITSFTLAICSKADAYLMPKPSEWPNGDCAQCIGIGWFIFQMS
jgi:hypothetical protein